MQSTADYKFTVTFDAAWHTRFVLARIGFNMYSFHLSCFT